MGQEQFVTYTVMFEKNVNRITGNLRVERLEMSEDLLINSSYKEIPFNPFYILGDLRKQSKDYKIYHDRTKLFGKELSYFSEYEYEYGFEEKIGIDDDEYSSLIIRLHKIIIEMGDDKSKKIEMLEELEKEFNIHPIFNISHLQNINKDKPIDNIYAKEYPKDLKRILNKSHKAKYTCSTMAEVIYSIIHYLNIQGHELKLCKVCQKIFAGKKNCCERIKAFSIDKFLKKKEKERLYKTKQSCIDIYEFIKDYCKKRNATIMTPKDIDDFCFLDIGKEYQRIYQKYYDEIKKCCCYTNIKIMALILSAVDDTYKGKGIGKDNGMRLALWHKENRGLDDISEEVRKFESDKIKEMLNDLKKKKEEILNEVKVSKDLEKGQSNELKVLVDSEKVMSKESEKRRKSKTREITEAQQLTKRKEKEIQKLEKEIEEKAVELKGFNELKKLEATLKEFKFETALELGVFQLELEILGLRLGVSDKNM